MPEIDKINILMVDDQPAKLLTYETILGELGENLLRAASGREALEHLLRTEIAVLLVDVNMPDMDGFELASIIRQHHRFQRTAIIFISAIHLTDLDRLKGYQLGAVDYVPVPVVPEILRAKVGVFVELYRKTRQLESMNIQLEIRVAERTAALAASEERFRLATEAMRGGLYDWTPQTDVWWISAGLAALLGDSPEAQYPSPRGWQGRIHPGDLEGGWRDARLALNTALPAFDVQYRVQHSDGHWVWVWDRGRIVRDEEGRALRVVGHVTDITSQKDAEDALRDADQRKDEFLATLSHELRNPLAPIRNSLNILRMKDLVEPDVQKGWEVIDRQVKHLSRLIDDLLDVSRISRNKFELRKARFDLVEALTAAVEASNPLLAQHGHQLSVSLPKSAHVDGDMVRLTQLFTNLLNNSAQYTPNGGQVSLAAELNGEVVEIRVRDTGKGIAADDLERVFQMFYRGNDAECNTHDGFGIGLTLAARVVELHGGSVEVHSAGQDAGTEFVVRLPLLPEVVPAQDPAGQDPAAMEDRTSIRRVLVVDDNVDSAESLAMLLKLQGYETRTAHDGLEAVQVFSHWIPDAVLLDIGIPKLNGYEVARSIREKPGGKNTLIIAQTGWGQDKDRQRTREAGCDAHLTKPLDYDVLMKLLTQATRKEQIVGM